MQTREISSEIFEAYVEQFAKVVHDLPFEEIAKMIRAIDRARNQGRHVFLFGNGGSAATASHAACDFSKGAVVPGKRRIKAIALTDNVPLLSAWANDTAYENVFAEQLANVVEPGDVVVAISGSGGSPNVLNGVRVANANGATTIALTGFGGGRLRELVDIAIVVPSSTMEQVEDAHLLIEHLVTTYLRVICSRHAG